MGRAMGGGGWPHLLSSWINKSENIFFLLFIYFLFFCLFFFAISWAAPSAYGGSQATGRIGGGDTGLHHSRSNTGFEANLQLTPELTATPVP